MHSIEQGTLHKKTLQLLSEDPRTIMEISVAAEVRYHWLQQLYQKPIPNPSVNTVQKLYEHLSGKKLDI